MKIIVLILIFGICSFNSKIIQQLKSAPYFITLFIIYLLLTSGPLYVGNNQIVVSYSYNNTESTGQTIPLTFQLINITSGEVIRNFNGASYLFQNILWMNGTQTFVVIQSVQGQNYTSKLILKIWNLTQSDPLLQYDITPEKEFEDSTPIFLTQVEGSTDHIVIAGGLNQEIRVLNIWTGEQIYKDQLDQEISGFALNLNRYSYLETLTDQQQDMTSCLIVLNPKTKKVETNIQLTVNMTSYEPQFYSISPFISKSYGNLLAGTIGNGTFFILDTLTGKIVTTIDLYQNNQDFICQTVNDEIQALYFCYSLDQYLITLYSGITNPQILDKTYINNDGAYCNIPESQQIVYITDTAIESWTYKTSVEKVIIS